MTTRTACLSTVLALAIISAAPVFAQISMRGTPPPHITAENESWYLSGSPIALNGTVYYPSGAVTHFSSNEMVPTGMFERIPIYKRTTREPGSIVYVPLPGGLVRPYERRRSGDLAGTVGSTAPSLPVVLPAEQATQNAVAPVFVQTPSEYAVPGPVGTSGFLYGTREQTQALTSLMPSPAPASAPTPVPVPVGTIGASTSEASLLMAPVRPVPTRIETVQRPKGLNTIFFEFRNARWTPAGPAVEFVSDRFTQIGEHRGFPVYRENGRPDTIYISLVAGEPGLVAPYKSR